MKDNRKVFNEGMKRFQKLKNRFLMRLCVKACNKLSEHIFENVQTLGVTGNLLGSIAYGIYMNRKLVKSVTPYAHLVDDKTLKKGEKAQIGWDEEGSPKYYTAPTGNRKYYGYEESLNFLSRYRPSIKGIAIVLVVGVEYAEYREKEEGANVLTDTFQFVRVSGEKLFTAKLDFDNAVEIPFELPNEFEVVPF